MRIVFGKTADANFFSLTLSLLWALVSCIVDNKKIIVKVKIMRQPCLLTSIVVWILKNTEMSLSVFFFILTYFCDTFLVAAFGYLRNFCEKLRFKRVISRAGIFVKCRA